jgi:CBS domain containing-hemolysin-like protein
VGGLVFSTLGHVPAEGECLEFGGYEFCAERVQGRRIVSVLIKPLPQGAGEQAAVG